MADHRRLDRRDGVVHRRLGDGSVLLDLTTGDYYGLNTTGALLWELLPGTVGEIAGRVRERHPDAPPGVIDQVRGFVDALLSRGLVTTGGTEPCTPHGTAGEAPLAE